MILIGRDEAAAIELTATIAEKTANSMRSLIRPPP
jgi:hypothetical protein